MQNYLLRIEKIKRCLPAFREENFVVSPSGTHHKVFLSKKYVVRFRDDNPKLLLREADFLKKLDHLLIPKVLWAGRINESTAMIENRLPGESINLVWKTLSPTNKIHIIKQLIKFLQYLRAQKNAQEIRYLVENIQDTLVVHIVANDELRYQRLRQRESISFDEWKRAEKK